MTKVKDVIFILNDNQKRMLLEILEAQVTVLMGYYTNELIAEVRNEEGCFDRLMQTLHLHKKFDLKESIDAAYYSFSRIQTNLEDVEENTKNILEELKLYSETYYKKTNFCAPILNICQLYRGDSNLVEKLRLDAIGDKSSNDDYRQEVACLIQLIFSKFLLDFEPLTKVKGKTPKEIKEHINKQILRRFDPEYPQNYLQDDLPILQINQLASKVK